MTTAQQESVLYNDINNNDSIKTDNNQTSDDQNTANKAINFVPLSSAEHSHLNKQRRCLKLSNPSLLYAYRAQKITWWHSLCHSLTLLANISLIIFATFVVFYGDIELKAKQLSGVSEFTLFDVCYFLLLAIILYRAVKALKANTLDASKAYFLAMYSNCLMRAHITQFKWCVLPVLVVYAFQTQSIMDGYLDDGAAADNLLIVSSLLYLAIYQYAFRYCKKEYRDEA